MTAPTPRESDILAERRRILEQRREIALAQLDVYIDVVSVWCGRYIDDDEPAGIGWIIAVIGETSDDPPSGVLYVTGTTTPGIGWRINPEGQFAISSLCRSFKGLPWPVTRRQFREAARKSGVSLPSRHATLFSEERT